jgi:hypothetical protein
LKLDNFHTLALDVATNELEAIALHLGEVLGVHL